MIREYEVTGTATVEIEYKTWLLAEDDEDFSDQIEALIEGGELEPLKITVTEPGVNGWRKI